MVCRILSDQISLRLHWSDIVYLLIRSKSSVSTGFYSYPYPKVSKRLTPG